MSGDITDTLKAKSDQLNAADLMGGPMTVTVISVRVNKSSDQPVIIDIGPDMQPYKPCLSMRRLLAHLWGPKSSDWPGRSMTMYCDPQVKWAGQAVGGIRISAVTGISTTQYVPIRTSQKVVATVQVDPLIMESAVAELLPYEDTEIDKNVETWVADMAEGKYTADALIKNIERKVTLTDEQKATIASCMPVAAAHEEPIEHDPQK
jgi:hypothetical protein